MKKSKIIYMGNSADMYQQITGRIQDKKFYVLKIDNENQLCCELRNNPLGTVIIENSLKNNWDTIDLSKKLKSLHASVNIVVLAENSSEELAIQALRAGVDDFFKQPVDFDEFIQRLYCILSTPIVSAKHPVEYNSDDTGRKEFIGECLRISELKKTIGKFANCSSNVLITGETGTGKELVATLIHRMSDRTRHPLISLNCAAIPDTLLESELFGHEKGAFTGAQNTRDGKLAHASAGSLFLDEIGDMSLLAQAKILRAIETKTVQKIGGKYATPVDIRVIAATNQELEQLVESKLFRKDLFFRLNIARINIPPLRERVDDIFLLCDHFVKEFNEKFSIGISKIQNSVMDCFIQYYWPGNVRELRNVIEGIYINRPKLVIQYTDLPELYQKKFEKRCNKQIVRNSVERDQLLMTLLETNWNKSKAAKKLNWSRMTIYRKMQKYNIGHNNKLAQNKSRCVDSVTL